MNKTNKLANARINLLNYINTVWNKDNLITKETIINGLKKACISGNFYLSNEEEKLRQGYLYDLGLGNNINFIDNNSKEMNLIEDELDISESAQIDLENGDLMEKILDKNEIGDDEKYLYNIQEDAFVKNELKNLENKYSMNTYNYSPMDLDE